MAIERKIGKNEVHVDEANIMTIVFRGPLGVQEMREILREHDGKLEADGDLFVISDLRAMTSIEPGARHALGARPRTLPGYCVAYMVANFRVKLFMEALLRAANFFVKGKVQYRFFDNEASARQWLLEMQRSRGRA